MNDHEFDDLLREWKPDVSVPNSFPRQVWQRIEAKQTSSVQSRFQKVWSTLGTALFHPRRAAFAALGMAALSAGGGYIHAEINLAHAAQPADKGAELYWRSINVWDSAAFSPEQTE